MFLAASVFVPASLVAQNPNHIVKSGTYYNGANEKTVQKAAQQTQPGWIANGIKEPKAPENKPLQSKWKAKPFEHQVFVENEGQFNHDLPGNQKVLFFAQVGKTKMYFTPTGVVYRNDQFVPKKDGKDEEEHEGKDGFKERDVALDCVPHFLSATWLGSNPSVSLSGDNEQTFYMTYPAGKNSTIRANVFKQLTYHDIYPGIDLQYTYPEGKTGIKYAVIVHPGADISLLKLKYSDVNLRVDEEGNVVIHSNDSILKDITDHAPNSFYSGGENVSINYNLIGSTESFSAAAGYDNTRTLVIDPWSTSVTFTSGYDAAYDLDYDNAGNVYVYGGYNYYQLSKFNSSGTLQWTFTATTISPNYYGDFATDKANGTCYITEGFWSNGVGAQALKVNTNGSYLGGFAGSNSMREMWRACYNRCSGQVVIGGGGTNAPSGQVAMLDTNMASIVPENPLGTPQAYWDVNRIAVDPAGTPAYMAISASSDLVYNYGWPVSSLNILMSVPVPALNPANYTNQPSGDALFEISSPMYVGPGEIWVGQWTGIANGMNGMAASPNWLYTYDGYTIKRCVKSTGATSSSLGINAYQTNGWVRTVGTA